MPRFVKRTIQPNEGLHVNTPCRFVNRGVTPIEVVVFAEQPTIEPTGVEPLSERDQRSAESGQQETGFARNGSV